VLKRYAGEKPITAEWLLRLAPEHRAAALTRAAEALKKAA
jgi:hypothetical protein